VSKLRGSCDTFSGAGHLPVHIAMPPQRARPITLTSRRRVAVSQRSRTLEVLKENWE